MHPINARCYIIKAIYQSHWDRQYTDCRWVGRLKVEKRLQTRTNLFKIPDSRTAEVSKATRAIIPDPSSSVTITWNLVMLLKSMCLK